MDMATLGAGVAVLTGLGAGIGIGIATGRACEAISRQPEAQSAVVRTMLLGCGLAEATAIYGLVVAMILVFLK